MTLKNRRFILLTIVAAPLLYFGARALYLEFRPQPWIPVIDKNFALAICQNNKAFDALFPDGKISKTSRLWLVTQPNAKGEVVAYALDGVVYDPPTPISFETPANLWHVLNEDELHQRFSLKGNDSKIIAQQENFSVDLKLADIDKDAKPEVVLHKRYRYSSTYDYTEETSCAYNVEGGKARFLNYGETSSGRGFLDGRLNFD